MFDSAHVPPRVDHAVRRAGLCCEARQADAGEADGRGGDSGRRWQTDGRADRREAGGQEAGGQEAGGVRREAWGVRREA